jgi:hypothetical protein
MAQVKFWRFAGLDALHQKFFQFALDPSPMLG